MYRLRGVGLTTQLSKNLINCNTDKCYSTLKLLPKLSSTKLLNNDNKSWCVNTTRNNTQHRVVLLPGKICSFFYLRRYVSNTLGS